MIYTDDNGKAHELPKLTLALQRKLDKAQAGAGEERYRAMYEAVKACVKDHAELLDGASLETIDLLRLQRAYQGIVSEYQAPAAESQRRAIAESLAALDGESLDKLDRFAGAIGAISETGRKGFSLVK